MVKSQRLLMIFLINSINDESLYSSTFILRLYLTSDYLTLPISINVLNQIHKSNAPFLFHHPLDLDIVFKCCYVQPM